MRQIIGLLMCFSVSTALAHPCGPALVAFQPWQVVDRSTETRTLSASDYLRSPEIKVLDPDLTAYMEANTIGLGRLERAVNAGLRYVALAARPVDVKALMATGVLSLANLEITGVRMKILTLSQYGEKLEAPEGRVLLIFDMKALGWPDFVASRREDAFDSHSLFPGDHGDLAAIAKEVNTNHAIEWKKYGYIHAGGRAAVTIWDLRAIVAGPMKDAIAAENAGPLTAGTQDILHDTWTLGDTEARLPRPIVRSVGVNPMAAFALKAPPTLEQVKALNLGGQLVYTPEIPKEMKFPDYWLPFARSIFNVSDHEGRAMQGRLVAFHLDATTPVLTFADKTDRTFDYRLSRLSHFTLIDYVPNGPCPERKTISTWSLQMGSLERIVKEKRLLIIEAP